MIIMGSGKYAPKYEWKEVILKTWPYNLAHAIAYGDGQEVSDEEADQMYNLYIPYLFNLLSTATERERKVIKLRFKEGLTLEQVGNEFNISRTKIAEIEARALRKLGAKCRRGLSIFIDIGQLNDWEQLEEKAILREIECRGLKYENDILREELWKRLRGFKGAPSIDDIIQADKEELIRRNELDELELSVRTYKTLLSAGFHSIKDVLYASIDDIIKLRRSNQRGFEEIVEKSAISTSKPIKKIMERFEMADQYRNKTRKHYYVTGTAKKSIFDTAKRPKQAELKERYEDISIDELELSCLPYNVLKRAGVDTVADLISFTKDEYMAIKELGKISIEEIIEKTEKMGVPTEAVIHLWQAALDKDCDRSRYEVLPEGILIRGCYPGEPDRMIKMNTKLLLGNYNKCLINGD